MSNFTSYEKKNLATWLDNIGLFLDISRLEDETLFDYKSRLIDSVRNKGNSTKEGLNNSLSRELGLEKVHIITIEPLDNNLKPYIEITSKYIRLYNDDVLDIELDTYEYTIGEFKTFVDMTSTSFEITYYDDNYENEYCKKIQYNNNIRSYNNYLYPSKLNILNNNYLKDISLNSSIFKNLKETYSEVTEDNDYYIDYTNGLIYSGLDANGSYSYTYYEVPFKLFYSPVVFYPLNDKDIDYLIKDQILTREGLEYKKLNTKGANFINELISVSPLNWGK